FGRTPAAGISPMPGVRGTPGSAMTSTGAESAGAGVADPRVIARRIAGVAPCISRSLIAAGHIVIADPSRPGEASALECAVTGLSPAGHGSKAATATGADALAPTTG